MTSPRRSFIDYLRDILDACQKAESFLQDMDLDSFRADEKTVYAVIRALEVIGEAAKQVPSSFREQFPHIPWRQMTGMRDKLIHDYTGVDIKRVYDTVRYDIPPLRSSIADILRDVESQW